MEHVGETEDGWVMTDSDPLPWPNFMAIPTTSIGIIPRYLSAALTIVWAAGL